MASQSLIPGLPDELALLCLAHISQGHHGVLECVSRQWRDALRSEDYGRIKAREGLCGDWLFVLPDEDPAVCWRAYDPSADRWRPLPPPPRPTTGHNCATLHNRLLVLGGMYEPSSCVLSFDPCHWRWSEAAPMITPRANFACAVVGGRLLVAGGCDFIGSEGIAAAETYDPVHDKWEKLSDMPEEMEACWGIAMGGKFHVVGCHRNHVIFDAARGVWERAPDHWELDRADRGLAAVALDGNVFGMLNEGLALLELQSGRWRVLGEPPRIEVPNHGRRLAPSGGALAVLRGWVYMVGGKGVAYNADTRRFCILKFPSTLCCDPAAAGPVGWLHARPIFQARGSILGCATLHQPVRPAIEQQ